MATGNYDFNLQTQPNKSLTGEGQKMLWWCSDTGGVPPQSGGAIPVYTVPTGKKLVLSAYDCSSQTSNNCMFGLKANSNFMHLNILTSAIRNKQFMIPEGTLVLSAGSTLYFYIENDDASITVPFYYNIMGMVVDV